MPTIQFSNEQLLQAVKQMNSDELESFANEVLTFRAEKNAPYVKKNEAELLLKINEGFSDNFRQRYDELTDKRVSETLTVEEQQEIISMGEQVEKREVERLKALTALAQLRQTSLDEVMRLPKNNDQS